MKDKPSHQKLVHDLLRQDSGLSDAHMEEQRAKLSRAVELAEQKERTVRRAVMASCILLCLMVLLMSALLVAFPVSRVIGGVITFVLLIISGTLLCLYNDKYRPAVAARREELQAATLADLKHQIENLKKELSSKSRD